MANSRAIKKLSGRQIDDLRTKLSRENPTLVVTGCDSGKTSVASQIMASWIKKRKSAQAKCLFVVSFNALIAETIDKLLRFDVSIHEIAIIGEGKGVNLGPAIQICTIQTLMQKPELARQMDIDIVIWAAD